MKKLLKILPVLAVFILCTMAYVPLFAQKDWKINTGILEISLREKEQELANRLNSGYEQIYSTGFISLGGYPKIRFKHGEHSFMLPDNSHVLASSQEGNGWGVTSIEVDAEFYRSDQPDKHLQARKKFLELLRELQAKGWKRYYYPGGARMADKIDIFQNGEDVYIDYEPSEQEWLNVFTQGLESLSYVLTLMRTPTNIGKATRYIKSVWSLMLWNINFRITVVFTSETTTTALSLQSGCPWWKKYCILMINTVWKKNAR